MTQQEIIKKVSWKDLRSLSAKEIFIENTLTLPWLLGSLTFAYYEWYIPALICSTFFFLTGLRQVHNGFHNALGTHKWLTWLSLYINSLLMCVSIHAVKFNHIRHHKYCMGEEDYEGKSGKMKWYGAILYGPIHIFMIHKITWLKGSKKYKQNMLLELGSLAIFIALIWHYDITFLKYHIIVMLLGEMLSAFFAVWTVHHDTEAHPNLPRTQRTWWKNKITYSMFYHLEHHLFPAVPTIKLPELAERIDKACPEIRKKSTF